MPWSWKLARIAGIDVYIHATFFLLVAWIAAVQWTEARSVAAAAAAVAFIVALFGCVVLHELGHALTARRYGIKTRDITLLPIGGLARLERMPEEPLQELWVALAGPAVNVVIAGFLLLGMLAFDRTNAIDASGLVSGTFVERLLLVNVVLAGFNLLPAFPMDGGRVLRALLATRVEYTRATNLAASIGQAMAILFGFVGLLGNPLLLFIALFVWIGAAQEATSVQMKSALAGIPVRRAMLTHYRTLTPESTLQDAVDLMLTGSQQDFPVVRDGIVDGLLTRGDLVAALAKDGRGATVADVMRRRFDVAHPGDMLEAALAGLQASGCQTLPVTHNGRLVGLVTMDNIGELVMIHAADRAAVRADAS